MRYTIHYYSETVQSDILALPDTLQARYYCTLVDRRIVMLHSFIKKTNKTPPAERRIAENRLKEVKNAHS